MIGVGYGNVRSTIRNHPEEFKEGEDFITVSKELAGQIGMKAKAGYIKRIMNQWTPKRMLTMEGVEHLAKWYSSYRDAGNPFEKGFKLTTVYNDTPIEDEADAIEENAKTLEVVQPKPLNIADVLKIKDGKVDGRSLHEWLQVETPYQIWFPRMCEYGFVEGVDFEQKCTKLEGAGRPPINHDLTIDMGKEVSMIQRTERGKQARRYFLECEKIAKAQYVAHEERPADELDALFQAVSQMRKLRDEHRESVKRIEHMEKENEARREQERILKSRMDTLNCVTPEGTPRQKFNAMMNKYALKNGIQYSAAWRIFITKYNTAYNTNLKLLIRNYVEKGNKKPTIPEFLEKTDKLYDAMRVVDKMLQEDTKTTVDDLIE
jgi:phage anti-repressor protein